MIEHKDEMAKRNGCDLLETDYIPMDGLDRDLNTILSLFQFMINNNDWAIELGHNIEFMSTSRAKPVIVVPYDFDMSTLIDSRYRVDPLPVEKEHELEQIRLYKGLCREREDLDRIVQMFLDKKQEIYSLYLENDYIQSEFQERSIFILDSFYEIIESPGSLRREIIRNCKTIE
jgi:hypothetical protein